MPKAIDLSHTLPPVGLEMPMLAQQITTVVYGLGAIIFVGIAIQLTIKKRSALPLLFLIGALLTLFLEPVVDALGNAVHPPINQYNIVTTNGHAVPWLVLIGYVWYFAALPLLCYQQMQDRTLKPSTVWKTYFGTVIGAALVEQIPLHFGVWVYYGFQPMKLGYMPMWWIFANAAAVIIPFLLIYMVFPKLTGFRQLLVVLLLPSGAFMGHAGSGWPMYNALGTKTETLTSVIMYGASLLSIGLSLALVWLMINIAETYTNASIAK